MADAVDGESVFLRLGEFGGVWVADGDGGDWEDEFRDAEDVDDLLGVVDGGAEVADAKSFGFGGDGEVLRRDGGVDGGGGE